LSGVPLDLRQQSLAVNERRNPGLKQPLPPFVDTHCHLEYVFERYEHRGSFNSFKSEYNYPRNFDGCIASFCDPAAFSSLGIWPDLLSEANSGVWASFGIHPHNSKYYHTQDLEEKVLKSIEHEKCVAFGEIGLDYGLHSPSSPEVQRTVLTRQLQLGVLLGKPLVLHCRDAEDDLFRILSDQVPSDWKIHLHCFTGKLGAAFQFLEHYQNLYVGVTGSVTNDRAYNVRSIAQKVPLERLLVETDAPYNTPRNLPRAGRCRFSHPAHAYYVAKEIANLKIMELREVLQHLRENTTKLYGI
jgi:TatD DNase family protein